MLELQVCSLLVRFKKPLSSLPKREFIPCLTSGPTAALRKTDEIGSLKPGMSADFTLMELVDEEATLEDGRGGSIQVSQILKVRGVCRAGVFTPIKHMPFEREEFKSQELEGVLCD